MTAFSMLGLRWRYFLAGLLFLAAICQLALCLYQQICHSGKKRRIADGAVFIAVLMLCAYVTSAAKYRGYHIALPWFIVPLAAALTVARAVCGIGREYRHSREKLSPASVKQALDNLDAGILFADGTGRAVLVNRVMGRLAGTLIGAYPQTLADLEAALLSPSPKSGIERIDDWPALFRFPDGRIWRFQTAPLDRPELAGFTQTTAQDMTELYEANVRFSEDNAALRAAIEKTRDMIRRIADMIPTQEALNMKIRVHDEIGTSLIALSKLVTENNQADTDAQLKILEHALVPFGSERAFTSGTFESAQRQASAMNVSLTFDGFVPPNAQMERLIASAALECVTNCVHHANGTHVAVKIAKRENSYTVAITNDGEAPTAPIVEGGGLSALHRNVESAGGEMRLCHTPRFLLTLKLPEERPLP